MSALIQVKDLNWHSAGKVILQNINFSLAKGEVLGIIGPNGAGKTSLLRCLTQLISGFSGEVKFNNQPMTTYSRRQLAQCIAVVAQQTQPIFSLSVFDVVRMGLLPHKDLFATDNDADRHQIQMALTKVGLEQHHQATFATLSGGEQQRALIARALVQGAQLLIMDEPTNHLDVFYQHQILHLVKQLNITVIMTVHDLNLAAQYCQRLLLLDHGQLIADGSPDHVLDPRVLSRVFRLPCIRDVDPHHNGPRLSFHLPPDRELERPCH